MFSKTTIHTVLRAFLSGAILISLSGSIVSASFPAERIFPDSTKGFIVIRNLKTLGEQWRKTQIGTLMNDPIMESFKKDFQEQMAKRMEARFGFTFDGIEQLPSGEVAAGMIAIADRTPGYVFTMDVTDRRKETEAYLQRLTKKLQDAGVTRNVEQYKEHEIVVFTFPERAAQSNAPERKTVDRNADSKQDNRPPRRRAYYLLKKDHLVVSDQQHLIRLIFDRMDDSSTKSLSEVEDYRSTMKRCLDDMPEGDDPLIRWYIEPLNYGESVRVLLRGPVVEKRRDKTSIFTTLKEQGFDAIRGVGGVVSIKAEKKEVVYRIFVHAKKPYRLAMRMLVFPDHTNFTPPTWMPADLARCSMFYVDPIALFDNFGTLFDALIMQGETGVWDDIIQGLKEDPNGPQIDLREELIVHLGHRVLGMSKYHIPITPQSESIVVAIELKEGKEQDLVKALRKLFDNDSEMRRSKHKSYILWHRVPAEDVLLPDASISGVPDLVSTPSTTGGARKNEAKDEEEAPPIFPEASITVAKGCLFIGTNLDYLKQILDRLDTELPSISGEAEYKEVDKIFASMGITDKPHFMQFFARTDETIRPTYELIRQGKMPQSQAILGKAINALFVPEEDAKDGGGLRQQAVDGSKLPEFEKVSHAFGPSGLFGASEEEGYFFKGFLLEKKAEETIGPARNADEKEKTDEKAVDRKSAGAPAKTEKKAEPNSETKVPAEKAPDEKEPEQKEKKPASTAITFE